MLLLVPIAATETFAAIFSEISVNAFATGGSGFLIIIEATKCAEIF